MHRRRNDECSGDEHRVLRQQSNGRRAFVHPAYEMRAIPTLWPADYRAYSVVKTMDSLRCVLGSLVDPVDCTLLRGDFLRWDRVDANSP